MNFARRFQTCLLPNIKFPNNSNSNSNSNSDSNSNRNLREFVYSRHPDPRRVWKGGSEQHLLTPLPRAPRAPGASSKKLDVAVKTNTNVTFGRPIPN